VYQIEYLFVMDPEIPTTIENGGKIMVMDHEGAHYTNAFISNEPSLGEVYAPEVNWYLLHSNAPQEEQHEVLELLYELRKMRHSLGGKRTQSVEVPRSVAIIGDEESAQVQDMKTLAQYYFDEVVCIDSQILETVQGQLGQFVLRQNNQEEVRVAQIIVSDSRLSIPQLTGVEWVNGFDTPEYLMKTLRNRVGTFKYPNLIHYNEALCDTNLCTKCQDICPAGVVNIDHDLHKVAIVQLECTGCGECLHVCPTRALDYLPFTQNMLEKVVQLCATKRLVIIPRRELSSLAGAKLPKGSVPLVVESCACMSDWHWLVILQNLGVNVVVYDSKLPEPTKKAIYFINELYRRIYDKEAILWSKTVQEFEEALSKEQALVRVNFEEIKEPQEDFNRRLSALAQALHVKNQEGVN